MLRGLENNLKRLILNSLQLKQGMAVDTDGMLANVQRFS